MAMKGDIGDREDQYERTIKETNRERKEYMGEQPVILKVDETFIISIYCRYQSVLTQTLQKEFSFET